ncbi:transcriptional regulator GutM [Salipaludibacillus agaradhaerens]|uniref:transcriptional regulator GutM n=1 Tax=Salipaludibacillus agaradhaerens TaxID=76935 RepID=UPI00099874B9|nr:transcriptional regulator GutM [Salipaludibacillus agaradhaerens]MCR6106940.1 transcriptional regulator GutM [Salipaludibacillus agaradhaerens]MCR6110994.1 transcriptional regulator GutM [Bacillus sp. A301a_S52]MCR6118972.1 transcriptional regulator GutM [Salipaludibacillus agaradhaerens]
MGLITLACGLLLMQSFLTFIQVRYYRKSVERFFKKYNTKKDVHLFTGQARRKFGAGSIVMLVVDEKYIVLDCQTMKGVSVLSKFKDIESFRGCHVGEILNDLQYEDKKRKKSAIDIALQNASENALLTISKKQMT